MAVIEDPGTIRSPAWDMVAFPINQGFNDYNEEADAKGWYDYVTAYGLQKGHHGGIDVGMPQGTLIRSLHRGSVVFAGFSDSFRPRPVWIRPDDDPLTQVDESRYVEIYGHLWANAVQTGQSVKKLQKIGISGQQTIAGTMTPDGSGEHLHFELREDTEVSDQTPGGARLRDPRNWLTQTGETDEPSNLPGADVPPVDEPPDSSPVSGLTGILAAVEENGRLLAVLLLGAGLVLVGIWRITR